MASKWILLCLIASVIAEEVKDGLNLRRKAKRFKHEGAVRLVGGANDYQGNVEVYHETEWGCVCDDKWDKVDADVVCRQLGYSSANLPTHSSLFGPAHHGFHMNNVLCEGWEQKLSDCGFDGWLKHDCGPEEVAGVVCNNTVEPVSTTIPTPRLKYKLDEILGENVEIRLRGGRVNTEGRVEIKTSNNSNTGWIGVCGDDWSVLEAQVICRSAGLGFAQMATQSAFFSSEEVSEIGLSCVSCRGNERKLGDCYVVTTPCHQCQPESVAGVICSHSLADLVLDYEEVARSAYLEDRPLPLLRCAMEENCLASQAYKLLNTPDWFLESRRLLRFTAAILNNGTAPFAPALPKHLWEFHQCHMHYHSMEVFATFDIYSGSKKVAEGHKASFCLEDNVCQSGVTPQFACANYGDQGISVNCTDIYKHNIDCQWVDITEIDPGIYTLKIAINPEFKVAEMTYENNAAICTLNYAGSTVRITDCYLDRP